MKFMALNLSSDGLYVIVLYNVFVHLSNNFDRLYHMCQMKICLRFLK